MGVYPQVGRDGGSGMMYLENVSDVVCSVL